MKKSEATTTKTSIFLSRLYSADDSPLLPRRFTLEERRKKNKEETKLITSTKSPDTDMRIIRDVVDDSSDAGKSLPSESLFK